MKVTGIIAEYNPFHMGHQYQLTYVKKKLGADYIVIAMSGDYVQRGTPAILPKHIRAEMALHCGADLVLELPAQIASSSAEFFARGAVSLLDGIGVVSHLCFGSEEGRLEGMLASARILNEEPDEYRQVLRGLMKEGKTFPFARNQALLQYMRSNRITSLSDPDEEVSRLLSLPNNILGIEYCRAILERQSSMIPVTLRRQGADYHEKNLKKDQAPSASALRAILKKADSTSDLREWIPERIIPLLQKEVCGNAFITEDDLDLLLHYRLLSLNAGQLTEYQDISPALAQRIQNRLNDYRSFSQFSQLLKTKEMTRSRIQRVLLHLVLGIRTSSGEIPYARILGFRRESAPLLKEIKKRGHLPLITKTANAASVLTPDALEFLEVNTRASNIYESIFCRKTDRAFVHEYQKPVIIL